MRNGCTILALALLGGCSSSSGVTADGPAPLDTWHAGDLVPDAARPPDVGSLDLAPDTGPGPEAGLPDAPSPSGLLEARGVIHLHSVYSHDGCDSKGLVNGVPDATCLKQLRDAICASKLDFAALTDHPAYMADYSMPEDLLYDASAGDQPVLLQGKPVANRITCASGHQTLISVGFEAAHMMPFMLQATPATQDLYGGITDATDLTKVKQQVQGLKALGGVVGMVHSEEADISAATINAGGFEAMEWYNIHANFSTLLDKDSISLDPQNIPQLTTAIGKLMDLGDFMVSGPHPDLFYLVILDKMPQEGFDKWRTVQRSRPITGILGSDIHQNVSVDPSMCGGVSQLACIAGLALVEAALGAKLPAPLKTALLSGGPLLLSDGDRVDSWLRLLRWLENRVLVASIDPQSLTDALRAGRSYGVLTIFGDPHLFSFTGTDQGGQALLMGDQASGALTLQVQVPVRPVAMGLGGVTFSSADGDKAELRTRLVRIDSAGSTTVQEELTRGAKIVKTVTSPGAYHVEIWIRPKHLTSALASEAALAAKEYLWVISNPIYLAP